MVQGSGAGEEKGQDDPGGGGPASSPASRSRKRSRDPKVFVLLRELSEVHLLLDHVSANPAATVSDLAVRARPKELDKEWIEKICQISWPPDGSDEEKAEDAALLIRAKDYLNRLSHPASGATIAFTLLVTQQDAQRERGKPGFWRRMTGDRPAGGAETAASPTRNSLAQAAYPDLIGKAVGFRRWMVGISVGLLAALVITCGLSWYVAYGNAALAELATARAALTVAQERINEAENAESARAREAADEAAPATGPAAPASAAVQPAPAEPFIRMCEREFWTNASQAQMCTARARARANVEQAEARLQRWLCWGPFGRCGEEEEEKTADAPARAAAFATIIGSAVLPFFYGLLGAGAAIIRSLSRKIRSSLLSPRDLHLSIQQLALGAVVGACIGLFIASPGPGADESLLGPVALSASALSFIAGFGVDAVFQALEALIKRIFNVAPPPRENPGDGLPRS